MSHQPYSNPTTPAKVFGVKRSHTGPPTPTKPNLISDAGNEGGTEEHVPRKKRRPLFWRLKISANPNDPPEYTPEYLALLQDASAQCKTPESPSPMKVDTLTISADYLTDLVEARWKAEREHCDAKYKFQLQEVLKLPQA
ncbi:hypothetical protein BDR05DRAFT_1004695 [Suillus weaverae]|nr:hypothetical protein BDR05DRAFT_1004695 [Suillus weaverae]